MKLQSIQALRGLAALLVVLYHTRALELAGIARTGSTEPAAMGGLFASGFAGVDLFFVISGFIMVWVTQDARSGPAASGEFLFARLTRIYPVWWVGAALGLAYMVMNSEIAMPPGGSDWAYIARSFFLIPQADFPTLIIGWTLIHEIYFYLVFALILLLPRGLMPYALLLWGGGVVAASFAGLPVHIAQDFLTLAVHPMTMEFIFGAIVGLTVTSGLVWRAGTITLISTLWLIAAICLQGEPGVYTLLWGRVLEIGLPCAALIYGVAGLNLQDRLAWLIPAFFGAVAAIVICQLIGVLPQFAFDARRDAAILAVLIGAVVMLIVIWIGWLLGQSRPSWLYGMMPFWGRVFGAVTRTGDWSYSIYLFHLFAVGSLQRLMTMIPDGNPLRLGAPGIADNLVFIFGGLAASILAGAAGYYLIERPAQYVAGRMRRGLFGRAHSV